MRIQHQHIGGWCRLAQRSQQQARQVNAMGNLLLDCSQVAHARIIIMKIVHVRGEVTNIGDSLTAFPLQCQPSLLTLLHSGCLLLRRLQLSTLNGKTCLEFIHHLESLL